MQASIQQFLGLVNRSLAIHDRLEASLRDLSRTGDVQACKATRKAVDSALKEISRELSSSQKPLITSLQSSSQAAHILPKVDYHLIFF